MLLLSITAMIIGPLSEQMYLTDWWLPHFVFNSFIKIEDLLFNFSIAGIVSSVYTIFRFRINKEISLSLKLSHKILLIIAILFATFGLFYIFHFHSFWATIIGLAIPVIVVLFSDRKSLIPIFLTGIFMLIFAIFGYFTNMYLNPNFVQENYLLNHLSGILILGIPIEELTWFFFAGIGIAAFQRIVWDKE